MDDQDAHIAACIRDRVCHCGEPLEIGAVWQSTMRFTVYDAMCPACYDGAPDSDTRDHFGTGGTPDAAVRAWAECIDPWPELRECSACEKTVTADRATAATHQGFGYPLCDECVE